MPAAVVAQIQKVRVAWGKLGDELEALEAILTGEATPGQQARDILKTYAAVWRTRYNDEQLVINWPKDTAIIKRLLRTLPLEEINRRIVAFFDHRDRFYVEARYPIAMFASAINKLGGRGPAGVDDDVLTAPPSDCRHAPKCRTDVECTRKGGR